MSQIVAIGERERLRGFALAGVNVAAAEDPAGARAAWAALPADVALVILTPAAHAALAAESSNSASRGCGRCCTSDARTTLARCASRLRAAPKRRGDPPPRTAQAEQTS